MKKCNPLVMVPTRLVRIAAITACAVAASGVCSTAQAAPSVGYLFEFSKGTGQHDMDLTPDAISGAALKGVRDGGIAAIPNPSTVDVIVEANFIESFEPEFQSLRIVSGTLSLKAPRAGAGNFARPVVLCQVGIQVWKTGEASRNTAGKVRDGIYQQAVRFAKQCRAELNNL